MAITSVLLSPRAYSSVTSGALLSSPCRDQGQHLGHVSPVAALQEGRDQAVKALADGQSPVVL